jgi:hypothetical protein
MPKAGKAEELPDPVILNDMLEYIFTFVMQGQQSQGFSEFVHGHPQGKIVTGI